MQFRKEVSTSQNYYESPLTRLYLSRENIDLIQQRIIEGVYDFGGYIIQRQEDRSLKDVMKSFLILHEQNLDQFGPDVEYNVEFLSDKVIRRLVPNIVKRIDSWINYQVQAQRPKIGPPLAMATSTSTRNKTYRLPARPAKYITSCRGH